MSFYENLETVCRQKGKTVTELLRDCGLSTSKGTAWKRGAEPKMAVVVQLAEHLDVPVNVLTGQKENAVSVSTDDVKNDILAKFSQLTPENQKLVMDLIASLTGR